MKQFTKTAAKDEYAKKLWQVPYVDVFKHFCVLPLTFGEANLKRGDVSEETVSV